MSLVCVFWLQLFIIPIPVFTQTTVSLLPWCFLSLLTKYKVNIKATLSSRHYHPEAHALPECRALSCTVFCLFPVFLFIKDVTLIKQQVLWIVMEDSFNSSPHLFCGPCRHVFSDTVRLLALFVFSSRKNSNFFFTNWFFFFNSWSLSFQIGHYIDS